MKFEHVHIDAFGRLSEVDTGSDPLPGLVVVSGPNEAGKSTFFHLLTSLLYGFYPASRDRNEYAPWNGVDASGSAVIRLSDGEVLEVERRLLSSPSGRLARNGTAEELRNRSLPWAEHVPRSVFVQVFAITLAELTELDEEAWGRVQDRLLGAMGSSELRPAREVAGDLEQEAGSLWRPNRRGNQRIRDLREEIRELRDRRRTAVERDHDVRDTVRRRDEARERLQSAREERQREQIAVDRVQQLLPVRTRLARIAELEREAGPDEAIRDLPPEPGEELARLDERLATLEDRLEELRREMEAPLRAMEAFGEDERTLLDRSREVTAFTSRASSWAAERARLGAVRQELRDLDRRLASVSEEILASSWEDVPQGPLLALSIGDLRARARAAREARDKLRTAEATLRTEGDEERPAATLFVAGLVLAATGVGLGVVAFVSSLPALLVPAVLVLVVAALLVRRRNGSASTGTAARPDELETRRSAWEAERAAVAELLRDLPVAPARLEEPDEGLVSGLDRLQELVRDRRDRSETARELTSTLEAAEEEARTLARSLGREPGEDAEAMAALLEAELRRAERARDAAESAEREVARLRRDEERATAELDVVRREADDLRDRLEDLGEGDAAQGAAEAGRRIRARERAEQLRDELHRGHPDLDDIRERIRRAEEAGESWTMDDADLARRKARMETLTGEIEELTRDAERLDQEARHMLEQETVDAVDGELAALLEEEDRLLKERDRRWILARLVRQADRRFREEHQPDLLRRASAHLAELTGGRWEKMVADDGANEHRFHLARPERAGLVPMAPPVSTGTLEQAYLALRLAIVDHLDEGQERLPLFLDEALVNWDPPRRDRGLRVLAELSETRQIFFFTCHPDTADQLETLGARRLELDGVAP
jgi:uncharacterized protein YhaN